MEAVPNPLPDDTDALKAIIAAQSEMLDKLSRSNRAFEALVEALRVQIARLKRQKYGASSEKIERDIAQLELALEDLEVERAKADISEDQDDEPAPADIAEPARSRRRGKVRMNETLERERVVHDPGETYPQCGGELRLVGEDISEILEFVTAKLKLIETARPKKSCRHCEAMAQSPAPTRPVRRGMAGPGRAYWPISLLPSMTTTCRSTVRVRFSRAWASRSPDRA